jgi:DNA repair exonuclease SbcCD ATPase subunit
LKLKNKELEEHDKNKPKEVPDPTTDPNLSADLKNKQNELSKLTTDLKEIVEQINQVRHEISILKINIEELKKINKELEYLKNQIENYINTNKQVFTKYGFKIEDIIKYEINFLNIIEKIKEEENRLKELEIQLKSQKEIEGDLPLPNNERQERFNKSLAVRRENLTRQIDIIKASLSEPQKKYQQYLEDLKKWEEKKKQIDGDENTIDTIKWLKNEIEYIDRQLNNDLTNLRNERLDYSLQIFRKKKEIADNYSIFKNAADERIKQFQNILGEYNISIDVSLKINLSFYDEFLGFIDQGRKGSFYGINEGKLILEKLIKGKDINSEDGIKSLLSEFIEYLENDKREGIEQEKRYIIDQISKKKNISNFYEYIFSLSYLEPTYELKLGNKNLVQLSPGERGALLIVFYLLLDREDIPLIIDQPEENLDNESVYRILRHFIRHVKKERQVIIVTHNPNLAIVGDAEQIIFVKINKTNKNTFSFESGSIENPTINKHASDILEGTLKAFDVRRLKYLRYNYE